MGFKEVLTILSHTIKRLRKFSGSNKKDIFGDGTNWTELNLI